MVGSSIWFPAHSAPPIPTPTRSNTLAASSSRDGGEVCGPSISSVVTELIDFAWVARAVAAATQSFVQVSATTTDDQSLHLR
jgi:hypothetical protein